MNYVFDYIGQALNHQKIIPGNTATRLSASCYEYLEFNLLCDGVDAGSTAPVAEGWIVGQTSGARAVIISATLTAGAYGNANARVTLRLKSVSGTFASTENIGYGANLDHFTVRVDTTQIPIAEDYMYKGMLAKAILISVYANTALCIWNGSTPDQTSLIGQPMIANSSVMIQDANSIRNFKCIDYTAASASVVQVSFYF
jgi:hypothetical protein